MTIKSLPDLSTDEMFVDTNSDEASTNLEEPPDENIIEDDVKDPDYELKKDVKKLASVKNTFDYPQVVSTIGKMASFLYPCLYPF